MHSRASPAGALPRKGEVTRRAMMMAAGGAFALGPRATRAAETGSRTITLVVGFPPGGGVDTGARLMARHLPRFLGGAPNIVVQNMPGAGGATAADFLFNKAPRDGLTLGVPGRDWPLVPLLDQRGVRYMPLEFDYIGSTGEVNTFVWINKALGITTPAQFMAFNRPVIFGGLTPDTQPSMVPKILGLDGFPVKVVSGYRGTAEIINAIETGEVDAIATNAASFARRPDMVEKTVRLFQLLPSRENVILASDHASERSRVLLQLTGYASATGMPLVAPPGCAADRVAELRAGFAAMAKDPEFASDADKIGEPYGAPISGARITEILRQTISATSPDILAEYRKLAAQA